jgi:hypothetical protein
MNITKGQQVRQIVPVITGVVTAKRFNDDTDQFDFCVDYVDADGNPAQRWFTAAEIEAVPQATATAI